MMDLAKLKKIEEYVKKNIADEYTFVHTQAMRPIAAKIAEKEGGDKEVIDLGVLFHDIERGKSSGSEHASKGAETTEKVLKEVGFDQKTIEKVVHCVAAHSTPWSGIGPKPKTIEAKIVYDADMVQQASPFGIIKQILETENKNFKEIVELGKDALINKLPSGIFTNTAKKMIKERMLYIEDFWARAEE